MPARSEFSKETKYRENTDKEHKHMHSGYSEMVEKYKVSYRSQTALQRV